MIRPDGWRALYGTVNEEGYLVPYEARLRAGMHREQPRTAREMVDPQRFSRKNRPLTFMLLAGDVVDDESLVSYNDLYFELMARETPPIPAWLGEHTPLFAAFTEGNEIVVYGALDLHIEDDSSYPRMPPGEKWYRYSAEGRLLGETGVNGWGASNGWIELYFPDYRSALEDAMGRMRSTYHDGAYIACLKYKETSPGFLRREDREPPEILAVFDYRGERYGPDDFLPEYDSGIFITWNRDYLEKLYTAQVRLGMTNPTPAFDLLGSAEGPIMTDPAPRPPTTIASRNDGSNKCVAVRSPDDPENPYVSEYGDWDYWCFENIGAENPEHVRIREERLEEINRKLREFAKAGKEPPADIYEGFGIIEIDPDDPWKHYCLLVDEDGFILPQVDPVQPRQTNPFARGYKTGYYQLSAGGIMPEEMLAAYEQAQWAAKANLHPPIPDWLVKKPTYRVTAGPDGEWITQGKLGSWEGNTELPYREAWEVAKDYKFHRYSPKGKLLKIAAEGQNYWPLLYTPELADAIADEEAKQAIHVSVTNGFVQIYEVDEEDCSESG